MNRIHRLRLDEDGRLRYALGFGCPRHHLRLNKPVVRCSSRENEAGRNIALVFAYAFGCPCQLLRRGISVRISRRTQNDDGIEAGEMGVRSRSKGSGQNGPRNQRCHQYGACHQGASLPAPSSTRAGKSVVLPARRRLSANLPRWVRIDQNGGPPDSTLSRGPRAGALSRIRGVHRGAITPGPANTLGWMALRAKIRPDEAESEGCGGSTVEDENEVWPDFRRNPSGRGQFSPFRCQSSLADTRYASLLIPRTEKNWLPRRHRPSVVLAGP